MYEHAPGQAWESPRSLIVHTSLSKKKQFSFLFFFDSQERDEWSVMRNKKYEALIRHGIMIHDKSVAKY